MTTPLHSDEVATIRDRRSTIIDTDSLGMAMLQMKIQTTQGLFNDHFAELQERLNDIKHLRDSMAQIRATSPNDLRDILAGTKDDDAVEEALEILRTYGIPIPNFAAGKPEDHKDTLIQSLDSKITHLNTTNQQGLIKVQQYQNEIHLAQDQLSAIESRRNRTAEKITSGIKGN